MTIQTLWLLSFFVTLGCTFLNVRTWRSFEGIPILISIGLLLISSMTYVYTSREIANMANPDFDLSPLPMAPSDFAFLVLMTLFLGWMLVTILAGTFLYKRKPAG